MRLSEELAKLTEIETVSLAGSKDGSPPSMLRLMLFPLKMLKRWISRKQAPDILHLGDLAIWPLGLLSLLTGKRTKVVISAHGTDASFHRRKTILGRAYGVYLRLGAKMLNKALVIANSHATREVLKETGWNGAEVIPLATDLKANSMKRQNNGRLLFAGRLVELKGCGWFIRNVLPLLPETIQLDVAGTIWDDLEKEALNNSRVNFLGSMEQSELARAYEAALCVVIPNIRVSSGVYEGFGLVAPEVASSGGVALAARCDGLTDAVIDGQTGFLIERENAAAWAEKICEVMRWSDGERAKFVLNSRSAAQEKYSWKRVANDTMRLYRTGNLECG